VVLLITGAAALEIDGLRRAVGDPWLERVPPHLTLVPPVNVRESDLASGLAVLRAAAAEERPFTLELGPTATFLPASPVLYLEIAGEVEPVHRLRERVFVAPFTRELEFPFVPHVTLLHEGDPGAIVRARAALTAYRTTVAIDRVHLLEEQDRVWRPAADAVLTAPAVIGRGSLPLEVTESEVPDPAARAFAEREWKLLDEASFGPGTRWERHPFALTARRHAGVIGVATGWTGLGVAYLSELMVAAGNRGEGIGSHLLAAFEALAVRRGCARLALRTDVGSTTPAFYAARGWTVEATFREWLGGLDFVQLRRDL